MESLKKRWQALHVRIRKPIVLVIGLLVIVAAGLTGPLPGPGGIPIFLIGIAILATEFEWAQRIRNPIVRQVENAGRAWHRHKIIGTLIIVVIAAIFGTISYFTYNLFKP